MNTPDYSTYHKERDSMKIDDKHKQYLINNPNQIKRYIGGAWFANQLDLLTAYIKLEQSLKTKFNG